MNVLSLFDGMSCGRIALDQLSIPVEKYYASEIDMYAMQVSRANYPDIIQLGDVSTWREWDIDWDSIDLVTGGFPCQSWSVAGKGLGDRDDRGKMFWIMLDIMQNVITHNPNAYYLMENVRMKKEFEEYITTHTKNALPNVYKHMINSALVSAQNRIRFYWTNIAGIKTPEDRGIVLRDILENDAEEPMYSNIYGGFGEKKPREHFNKSITIRANSGGGAIPNIKLKASNKEQMIETATSDNGITNIKKGTSGKSWFFEQQTYSKDSKKTRALKAGGGSGNIPKLIETETIIVDKEKKQLTIKEATKKGYTTIDNGDCFDMTFPNSKTRRGRNMKDKSNCLTAANYDYMRYEHSDKDKEVYWRKLTPLECERLQTVPDNYTNHVSNTQRYKMLGNGWTVEVIKHIFKNMDYKKGK